MEGQMIDNLMPASNDLARRLTKLLDILVSTE